MKQCPQCGSTYTDDTLSFCLTDGAPLDIRDPARTERFELEQTTAETSLKPTENARVRIDLPSQQEQPYTPSSTARIGSTENTKGINRGVVAGLVAALIVVIGVLGSIIVYLAIQNRGLEAVDENSVGMTEKKEERDSSSRENLSDDTASTPTNPSPAPPEEDEPEFDEEVIKRVNSPNDGFLALRNLPDAEKGTRIAKIPHGDIVVLGRCQTKAVKIGIRTGYWCRARWEGLEGWVFDVWLTD